MAVWTLINMTHDDIRENPRVVAEIEHHSLQSALAGAIDAMRVDSMDEDYGGSNAVFYPHLYTQSTDVYAFFERVGHYVDDTVNGGLVFQGEMQTSGYIILRPGGDASAFIANGCRHDPMDELVAAFNDGEKPPIIATDIAAATIFAILDACSRDSEHMRIALNSISKAGYFVDVETRDNLWEVAESTY